MISETEQSLTEMFRADDAAPVPVAGRVEMETRQVRESAIGGLVGVELEFHGRQFAWRVTHDQPRLQNSRPIFSVIQERAMTTSQKQAGELTHAHYKGSAFKLSEIHFTAFRATQAATTPGSWFRQWYVSHQDNPWLGMGVGREPLLPVIDDQIENGE